MRRMAGQANQFFLFQFVVGLCFYNIIFVVTVKTKGISNLSNECFYPALVDIMASDAIHSSRPMNKIKIIYHRRMAFQADILGRKHRSAYTPMARGAVIFPSHPWVAVSNRLWR